VRNKPVETDFGPVLKMTGNRIRQRRTFVSNVGEFAKLRDFPEPSSDKDLGSVCLSRNNDPAKERGMAWMAAETGTALYVGNRLV
jgi:hypothetical protein